QSEPAGMKVDQLAQVSDVLRGFVGDARNVIVINEKCGGAIVGRHLLNINYGAVGDAPDAVKPFAALPLQIIGGLRFAPQHEVGESRYGSDGQNQDVQTNGSHM